MSHLPTAATGNEGWAGLVQAGGHFTAYVFDRPIVFLWDIPNVSNGDGTPALLLSHGVNTIAWTEQASSETCGFAVTADGDTYATRWYLPVDIDLGKAIDLAVEWTASGATGSATFKILYKAITASTTALGAAATALDTVIADCDVDGTAAVPIWTAWGSIAASTLAALTPGDDSLVISTEQDTFSTITTCEMFQTRLRYYRRYLG